ncbi:MAG: hypothetical protein N2606_02930 [Candidatus Omnitrophica bacterium]|nr:hypothetical protein [Candidatus Omnitrophota bacterium]
MRKLIFLKKNKSQVTVLLAFFLLVLVGLLSASLAVYFQTSQDSWVSLSESAAAFYLANAGIERMRIEIAIRNTTSITPINETLGDGRYNVSVNTQNNTATITSVGQFRGARRIVRVRIVGSGSGPPYGWANGFQRKEINSWQED